MDEQVLLQLVRDSAGCGDTCCCTALSGLLHAYFEWDAAAPEQAATVQVTEVSCALAVHTMQLQMEYVAASLEDEALDLAERSPSAQLLLNR